MKPLIHQALFTDKSCQNAEPKREIIQIWGNNIEDIVFLNSKKYSLTTLV